ncbi:MAG: HlyC/CorC family transporter [SAR202 cluster bacterium]|nr:HlyC/CorC family transporter [SAR202 cluster bacterium]
MLTLTFLVIISIFLSIFIFLNSFFNNTSTRSLVVPDSDDVEESTKNAKDISKILVVIRFNILILALINSSLLSALFVNYELFSSNFLLFISSLLILFVFIGVVFIASEFIPENLLKRFAIFAKLIRPISIKIIDSISLNGNANGNAEMNNENSDEIEVFEAAGLSVDQDEMKMIKGILRMDIVKVREIMKPRVDLVTIEIDSKFDELSELISDSGYSKIPVIGDSIDDVKGIVYAKDALKINLQDNKSLKIDEIMRPAIYVPESQSLEQLLSEFQDNRTRIAIVMDEHGGISGLVTVTDLIEEIVGELVDEFDQPDPSFYKINDNNLIVDARVSISDLNEEIGSSIQINGYDTIGGLVYKELGKMPSVGDKVNFEGLEIVVQSTIGRRIGKLRIRTITN